MIASQAGRPASKDAASDGEQALLHAFDRRQPAWQAVLAGAGCALAVLVVSAVGLARLGQVGVITRSWLWLVPFLVVTAVGVLLAVATRDPRPRNAPRSRPVLATGAALLLTVIGFLVRLSRTAHGVAVWSQPLIAALGVIVFFTAIELTVRYSGKPSRHRRAGRSVGAAALALIAAALVLAVIQVGTGPGREAVVPGGGEFTEPAGPFLAIFILACVALAPARLGRLLDPAAPRRWSWCTPAAVNTIWPLLPAGAALVFFAFTRDFALAVPLLVGAIAACAWERTPLRVIGVSVAVFILGTWLVTGMGTVLGYPDFTFSAVLHANAPTPGSFITGQDMLFGPGYAWRATGFLTDGAGFGPDVLIVIARETGWAGVIGVWLVFAVLLVALFRLVPPRGRPTASALGRGLSCLIAAQTLFAVLLMLPPVFPAGIAPPLLAGGAADFVATFMAIGILIGLSWRTAATPASSSAKKRPKRHSGEPDSEVTTA